MLNFHVKLVQKDRWTVKQYAPHLSMRGHKNRKLSRDNMSSLHALDLRTTLIKLLTLYLICQFKALQIHKQTRAITKRDHTPQMLLVTKQINVTGMQNKQQKRA